MAALKASLAARGQQTPVEVVALAAGALAIGAALLPKAKKGVRRLRLRP